MHYRRHLRHAFTLIELLAVIAVIAVLFMISIPALQKIRESSDNATCVSNLRRTGAAALLYFAERDGKLLPQWTWFVPADEFCEYLGITGSDLGSLSYHDTVLTCPAIKKKFPSLYPSMWNRGYSVNIYTHCYNPNQQQAGEPADTLFPGNLKNIPKPSAMWMFMDGAVNPLGGFVFTYHGYGTTPYASAPHAGKQNAVFFDNHVEPVETNTLMRSHSDPFWGGPQ